MATAVQIDNELKERVNRFKIHSRDSYNGLISRLMDSHSPDVASRESMIETLDLFSDAEIMRGIARGLKDNKAGRKKPLEQITRELEQYCRLTPYLQQNLRSLSGNKKRQ